MCICVCLCLWCMSVRGVCMCMYECLCAMGVSLSVCVICVCMSVCMLWCVSECVCVCVCVHSTMVSFQRTWDKPFVPHRLAEGQRPLVFGGCASGNRSSVLSGHEAALESSLGVSYFRLFLLPHARTIYSFIPSKMPL